MNEPTPLPIPPDVTPFTVSEVAHATGIRSLEAIWERIDTTPGWSWPGDAIREIYRPTPNDFVTIGYWSHTCARVVRALAVWSCMDDRARALADPIWHSAFSEDHRHVAARVIAALAGVESPVVWQAMADLVDAGLIPGEIEHVSFQGRVVRVGIMDEIPRRARGEAAVS